MNLLLNSAHGVYIPNLIALAIIEGRIKLKNSKDIAILEALSELGNIENEYYFEMWQQLTDNAIVIDEEGNEYYIYQDEDVWAIPINTTFEDWIE